MVFLEYRGCWLLFLLLLRRLAGCICIRAKCTVYANLGGEYGYSLCRVLVAFRSSCFLMCVLVLVARVHCALLHARSQRRENLLESQ